MFNKCVFFIFPCTFVQMFTASFNKHIFPYKKLFNLFSVSMKFFVYEFVFVMQVEGLLIELRHNNVSFSHSTDILCGFSGRQMFSFNYLLKELFIFDCNFIKTRI